MKNTAIPNKKVIIIGSGIGGLCTGLRLLHAGFQVAIYEKESYPGGATSSLHSQCNELLFDRFASIGIHPGEYDKIFRDVHLPYKKYYKAKRLTTLYKVFYSDHTSFVINNNMPHSKSYRDFVNKFYLRYLLADRTILTKAFYKPSQILSPITIKAGITLTPWLSSHTYIKHYIKSQKLRRALEFQSFYMGIPPHKLSSVYATIPAVTQVQGLLYIQGGIGAYTNALVKAFQDLGGTIHYNHPVERILTNHKVACGILSNNRAIYGDIIVSNADYQYTVSKLLSSQRNRLQNYSMSCSVFIMHLGLNIVLPQLNVHNIYIDKNFEQELANVACGKLPKTPPVYFYYPAAVDKTFQMNQMSSINIMIRVPNLSHKQIHWNSRTITALRDIALRALKEVTQMEDIHSHIVYETYSTPLDLKKTFHYTDGAAFGIAPKLSHSLFFRPQIKSKTYKNLYFTGSSIHPGNGISIVMKGAKTTADTIIKEAKKPFL